MPGVFWNEYNSTLTATLFGLIRVCDERTVQSAAEVGRNNPRRGEIQRVRGEDDEGRGTIPIARWKGRARKVTSREDDWGANERRRRS